VNQPIFLGNEMADRLMLIATNLAEELYIAYDRLATVEHLLEKKGLVSRAEVESFVPDEAFSAELKAFRKTFLDRIFSRAVESTSS
jgi:hypothetical protein